MIIFRCSFVILMLTSGCTEVSRPAPRNDLERSILIERAKARFAKFVAETEPSILRSQMKEVGFRNVGSDEEGCIQYRYDRKIDAMGQRVTAQIFECGRIRKTEIGYTFL